MTQKYTKNRQRLVSLIEATGGLISISDAEGALSLSRDQARRMLWSMTKSGWLKAVKSGLYAPVSLEASSPAMQEANPLALANYLFSPCYIGGWTAANMLGLTDQIFLNTWVMTTKKVANKKRDQFVLTQIDSSYLYGTKAEWVEGNKIMISDASKTLVDFLNFPGMFSASSIADIFKAYMTSSLKDLILLQDYAIKAKNKTIFKRLGFLTEKFYPTEKAILDLCKSNLSSGYSALSVISDCDRIVSRWKLKIPANFIEEIT